MRAMRWVVALLSFSVVALMAAEWAPAAGPRGAVKLKEKLALKLAQLLPFERNKVEPIDPNAAFVEGYQAYKRRDLIETIGRMRLASSRLPDLADYAFF